MLKVRMIRLDGQVSEETADVIQPLSKRPGDMDRMLRGSGGNGARVLFVNLREVLSLRVEVRDDSGQVGRR